MVEGLAEASFLQDSDHLLTLGHRSDGLREVCVGILVIGEEAPDERDDISCIELVGRAQDGIRRLRELGDDQHSRGADDAM